nr:MAG TPA: tail protein [Caudoviricetes sp.]
MDNTRRARAARARTRYYPFLGIFSISSNFGSRAGGGIVSKQHYGLDLVTSGDRTIVSCMSGVVKRASPNAGSGYGNHVWIANDDGSACLYAHLASYNVSVGQRVSAKQKIGIMGSTGNSTGPHLHLGVSTNQDYSTTHTNKNKYFQNPAVWLGLGVAPKAGSSYNGSGTPTGITYGTTSTNETEVSINSSASETIGGINLLPSGEYYEIKNLKGAYSDWLYGRRYRVFVDLGNNQAFDVSELRCEFNVVKTAFLEVNESTLTIYNLNPNTENKLIKAGQRIIIEAGYTGSQYGVIFAGKVVQPIRSKENAVDYKLTLVSMDEEVYASYGLVGVSLVAQQSARDAVNAVLNKATYKQESGVLTNFDITYPRGKVMFGSPQQFLKDIARSENATYYSDDGKVNIISASDLPSGSILSFGPDSGLIGTPTQTEYGINLKVLMNPRITINSLFHVDNKKIEGYKYQQGSPVRSLDQEGIYRAVRIRHYGDTRGDDWFTEIDAISQAGLLPGMTASKDIYGW